MKKLIATVVFLGLVGVVAWQAWVRIQESKKESTRRRGPGIVAVEVSPVGTADVRDVGVFTGSLESDAQFLVAAKVPGRLVKLHADLGDPVVRGQLLAELDSEEYAQAVEAAKAELAVAKANVVDCLSALDVANRELNRITALRDKKIASESELDAAEARHKACQAKRDVATAQVSQKEADLKAAEIRLSYANVFAAWSDGDGNAPRVVGERFVHEGALLRANDSILSVLDDRRLLAVLHVIERDYPKLKAGQEVALATDAYPGRSFRGRVARIAPLLKESSRQGRVEVEVDNAERLLKPGMYIAAQIEFAQHAGATVVPRGAVTKRGGKEGVFLLGPDERTVKFIPVRVGVVSEEQAEIVDPPLSGRIISLGQHLLEDGAQVRLPQQPSTGPSTRPGGGGPAGGGGAPGAARKRGGKA